MAGASGLKAGVTVRTAAELVTEPSLFEMETVYFAASFCAVFSIQDVRIVRQWKKPTNHMLNLEERIGYGLYEKTIN
ncbi:MAG: hypothetical protein EBQ97_02440 [Bacteroidetes bacterium]|nr:hypothetical protein [Bacteroidota bacterium]